MGITKRALEDRASDLAEELAEKQTGMSFGELPPHIQITIWDRAWQLCVEADYEAAERLVEMHNDIQMEATRR